jgi:HrpA-like RNA helicase
MTVIASMLCVENIYYSPPRKQQGRFGGGRNNPPAGPSKIVMKVGSQGSSAVRSEPRVREEEFKSPEEIQAETAHNLLKHPYGDHFTYLNIFNRWKEDDYSQQWCEQNYINYKNMKTARKIR